MTNTDTHYKSIAQKYDYFYEPNHRAMVPSLIDKLELKPDDHLLDLGAGTGQLASMIRNTAGLKNPVTCVEPCEIFLEYLYKLDGINVVAKTGEEFYDELSTKVIEGIKIPFNKILIVGALHHFSDPNGCLDKIAEFLPKGGIFAHAERPNKPLYPLPFAKVHLEYIRTQETATQNMVPHLKTRDDIVTEVLDVYFKYPTKKARWYDMIRGRYQTTFNNYTDEELEQSIQSLDKGRFSGLKDNDDIIIDDHYIITRFTKK